MLRTSSTALAVAALLAACAYDPIPKEYAGPVAVVWDTSDQGSSTLAYFFYVASIDGHHVDNALEKSAAKSEGKGFVMLFSPGSRKVPAGDIRMTIEAATHHAAPFLDLFGPNYDISGDVTLHAQADGKYVVKGTLQKNYCAVWVENIATSDIVTPKIEKVGC